jgi:hypothetical protein
MSFQTASSLERIKVKVRRLTRSPSSAQITDDQIEDYVNDFFVFDFPEELRTKTLDSELVFYAQPGVSFYPEAIDDLSEDTPLYEFLSRYTSFGPPAYCKDRPMVWVQSKSEFTAMYPNQVVTKIIGTGDGSNDEFSGTVEDSWIPFLENNVTIFSVDANGNGITLSDVPRISTTAPNNGYLDHIGDLQVPFTEVFLGEINYLTGAYDFDFPVPPAAGAPVYIDIVPYTPGIPDTIFFDGTTFQLRPVPNQVIPISIKAQSVPVELLGNEESPVVAQWWQYIAYGTAIKILQDRMDLDSVNLLMPEFKRQEHLVERSTIVQLSSQRSSTIYSQTGFFAGFDGWNNSNG